MRLWWHKNYPVRQNLCFVLFGLEHLKHKLDRHNLRVINFDSVWFFFLKIIKSIFFLEKNRNCTETGSNRPVSVRFGFLGQKLVQISLARFFWFWLGFLGFGSVFSGFGSVFLVCLSFFGLARFFSVWLGFFRFWFSLVFSVFYL